MKWFKKKIVEYPIFAKDETGVSIAYIPNSDHISKIVNFKAALVKSGIWWEQFDDIGMGSRFSIKVKMKDKYWLNAIHKKIYGSDLYIIKEVRKLKLERLNKISE